MTRYRIYIDTNVILNDFLYRNKGLKRGEKSYKALENLYSRGIGVELFLASFSIAQYVAVLSNNKFPLSLIIKETNRLLAKFTIIDFGRTDIEQSINNIQINKQTKDLEDQMQFEVCKKIKCNNILTENYKDYRDFANINVVKPENYRAIFVQ